MSTPLSPAPMGERDPDLDRRSLPAAAAITELCCPRHAHTHTHAHTYAHSRTCAPSTLRNLCVIKQNALTLSHRLPPDFAAMDVHSEAPSCDPEVQADILKARELVSPALPTLAVPVGCGPRPAPDVATAAGDCSSPPHCPGGEPEKLHVCCQH